MVDLLRELGSRRAAGQPVGITSVCSAHALVIEAAMRQALDDGQTVLIEATCNQVNQLGGYTGMTPSDFMAYVRRIADTVGFDWQRVLLGGDHLGPNPWRHLPQQQAMAHACDMVRAYARAGFTKLHLDASMRCADDPDVLTDDMISERAAVLCQAAEAVNPKGGFVYVVGTEVPVPGGPTGSLKTVDVTPAAAARHTVALHQAAFERHGLLQAWQRVIALVVQPGVEFDHDHVVDYRADLATELSAVLAAFKGLVFEAHSTDYQHAAALKALVRDGFAILKVGPGLTFALREALQALCAIEQATVPADRQSRLMAVLESVMLQNNEHWSQYYKGSEAEISLLRQYSFSDRSRYYLGNAQVTKAQTQLFDNLRHKPPPLPLLSQFLPLQYQAVRLGRLANKPKDLVLDHIRNALRPYAFACGGGGDSSTEV